MTTTKYVFDPSARALHRVAGRVHPWEELSPGIRVRRRVIRPPHASEPEEPIAWYATFDDEDDVDLLG
ncbi:MAG: hypothetical protein KDK70_15215 [Myxococcales bacterium]|nr:hypothetical protein [Myxococcales bacterium]